MILDLPGKNQHCKYICHLWTCRTILIARTSNLAFERKILCDFFAVDVRYYINWFIFDQIHNESRWEIRKTIDICFIRPIKTPFCTFLNNVRVWTSRLTRLMNYLRSLVINAFLTNGFALKSWTWTTLLAISAIMTRTFFLACIHWIGTITIARIICEIAPTIIQNTFIKTIVTCFFASIALLLTWAA